ncbi:NAD(P)/FAD-dependent oxidoreductase [Roseimaritima ulvae]|uniref:Tryptophan halogenase n=1 Tax=Roseimaritima ulvae TaxID=980254 RepID=A0A5B9QUW6_9BACT|nr:tryptophan 7-halogenase [Roseimaritima ulvae]QEG41145.1 Tryptophan halogenase [Roseimaritima ulvae]
MREHHAVDVAVVGAGCGGSLIALLLNRIGLSVVLLDRGSHPRFAIGESSTPTADLVLRDLAQRYELPALLPLSQYGTWKANYPQLTCGLKRGFSYFHQCPGQPFRPLSDHSNELLVAASSDDRHADTHWLRSDVDAFLVRQVQAAGIPYIDQTEFIAEQCQPTWKLSGSRENIPLSITAKFLIDATGEAAFLPHILGLTNKTSRMRTNSRALFAHFEGVTPWQEMLVAQNADLDAYPFRSDIAAVHHLLQEGWMWQLRFDNGVTSVGFALEGGCQAGPAKLSPTAEWNALLERYPTLADQFADARVVAPERGLTRTGRLQRRWEPSAGENWALLPHTAGFVDPLYSPGLAQTMCGVERLVGLLEQHWGRESLPERLAGYQRTVAAELDLIDRLVHGSYRCRHHFDLFVPYSMLYFAAATTYEQRRLEHGFDPGKAAPAFLCADEADFQAIVGELQQRLEHALASPDRRPASDRFFAEVAEAIAPYNHVGLCDRTVHNMYHHTAVNP